MTLTESRVLVSIFVPAVLALSACNDETLEQVGYFKGSNNNRVFQLVAHDGTDPKAVQERAENLMHTPGRMTIAFIFEHDSGGDIDLVTHADSFTAANSAVIDQAATFRWWFRQSPNEESTFIDCVTDEGNTICPNSD